jgi:hypothetical protein
VISALYLLSISGLYFYSLRQWFKVYFAGFVPIPSSGSAITAQGVVIRPQTSPESNDTAYSRRHQDEANDEESVLINDDIVNNNNGDFDEDSGDEFDKHHNVKPFRREVSVSMQIFRWFTAFVGFLVTLATMARLSVKITEGEPYSLPFWVLVQKFFYFVDVFAPDGIWMITSVSSNRFMCSRDARNTNFPPFAAIKVYRVYLIHLPSGY